MNGVINVLKPPGMTSHDVVSFIRKVSGIKKVGHTGTLDPGAAGVLPVCIGKSTKIVDYIMNDRKAYICELTLGNATNTYDKYGEFLYEKSNKIEKFNKESLTVLLEKFTGNIEQTPPAFSAIKINGKRAYDMARNGEEPVMPSRRVWIYNIELIKFTNTKIMLKINCSKGTYIRSICNDIGKELGCGAYMSFLIRTGTGRFNLENSYVLSEITKDNIEKLLVSPDFCLNMKDVYIQKAYRSNILNGNSIPLNMKNIDNNEFVKIYMEDKEFIGIGRINNNILYIEKLLS